MVIECLEERPISTIANRADCRYALSSWEATSKTIPCVSRWHGGGEGEISLKYSPNSPDSQNNNQMTIKNSKTEKDFKVPLNKYVHRTKGKHG